MKTNKTTKASKNLKRPKQADLFAKEKSAYGGVLRNTRKGRQGLRKLSTKHTMHVVLRSSKAKGDWSFTKTSNRQRIREIINKHARKNHIYIQSVANVGNHLHLHIKLLHRDSFKTFIRSITGTIALLVMGASRVNAKIKKNSDRFWDYRPYTTFVDNFKYFLNMQDYMRVNQLEGVGFCRTSARFLIAYEQDRKIDRRL